MFGLRFTTSPVKALAAVLFVTAFITLGFWQLQRAQDKAEIQEQVRARSQLRPVEIGADLLDVHPMAYRKANASGRYKADLQILLDNQVHQGDLLFLAGPRNHISHTQNRLFSRENPDHTLRATSPPPPCPQPSWQARFV